MRRNSGLTKFGRRNTSDEMFAVLDVQVARSVFWVGEDLPSKKARVEIRIAFRIGRA